MRITPVSMTYTRHNLRPQNQNIRFSGEEKKKEYTREEIKKMRSEYAEKVRKGEIVPKESEPEYKEHESNLEKAWDLYGTRN